VNIGLDTFPALGDIPPARTTTPEGSAVTTDITVPRPLFAVMYLCTAVVLAAGCVALLSWLVTGLPHPSWIKIDDARPPITHRTAPCPAPLAGEDLIPPTDLPTR
jgi:hypothetical protein